MAKPNARVRIGDIVEIPLTDGRRGYAQYVFFDSTTGYMIQVFDLITTTRATLEQLGDARPLFPPVFTALIGAFKAKIWVIIGNMPVRTFAYPPFISRVPGPERKMNWILTTENGRLIKLGPDLPMEYQSYEVLAIWQPHDIAERIATGKSSLDLYFGRVST